MTAMSPGGLLTAAVVAVVSVGAVWLARRVARALRTFGATLVTELSEIARIPAEVGALVSVVAQLVAELRTLKKRLDRLETAFAALDLTPDHVTLTAMATTDPDRERHPA